MLRWAIAFVALAATAGGKGALRRWCHGDRPDESQPQESNKRQGKQEARCNSERLKAQTTRETTYVLQRAAWRAGWRANEQKHPAEHAMWGRPPGRTAPHLCGERHPDEGGNARGAPVIPGARVPPLELPARPCSPRPSSVRPSLSSGSVGSCRPCQCPGKSTWSGTNDRWTGRREGGTLAQT